MITMTLNMTGSLEAKATKFYRVLTESVKTVVKNWHKQVLPKHFETGAARRYGYKARSQKYQRLKNRRGLGPLVYSGRSKRQLTRAIRTVGSRGNIKGKFITDSRISYFWRTPAGHPNKGKELVAASKRETQQIKRAIKNLTADSLDKIKDKKKVR